MKYILTLVLLILLCSCGCNESQLPTSERVAYISGTGHHVYKFTFEGHDYLYSYRTGMIHSESCKSPEHYDTK